MKLNKEYKQIFAHTLKDYNELSGKVVDKVAYTDRGYSDENMFIITFTDKTFIAIGVRYKDLDNGNDEPQIEDFYVIDPQCCNGGDYRNQFYVHSNGKITFDRWITILKDFNIWDLPEDEALKIVEDNKKKEEEREYQYYLKLKEKFKDYESTN